MERNGTKKNRRSIAQAWRSRHGERYDRAVTKPQTFPLADADLCVKCGLCLPHCPTYAETGNEADSPRGRIALMQGLASGLIPLTAAAEHHLDGCLSCRRCEVVCPAKVPYGRLIDSGRAWLMNAHPGRARGPRMIAAALASPPLRALVGTLLWFYQRVGPSTLLRRSARFRRSRIGRLEALLPRIAFVRGFDTRSDNTAAAHVDLFTGCTGALADRASIEDAIRLLSTAGYTIRVPPHQVCCGALHLHSGLPAAARRLLEKNRRAFAGAAPIVTFASGCAEGLRDNRGDAHAAFATRITDVFTPLLQAPRRLRFRPLKARIAVQVPCTQAHAPGGAQALLSMLRQVPGVEIVPLAPARACCGAAGSHFITQPDMAGRLLDSLLDAIEQARPDVVVTANIGCRLHIAAGLRQRGNSVQVVHPVSLLAQQLIGAPPTASR
jgi:glycolate oxidase iron-sulfur subunit